MKSNSEAVCTSAGLDELARELLEMNLRYSKQVLQLASFLSASGEYSVLYYLFPDHRAVSAGELAEKLDLTPGRIANVLKALEKKEFISRYQDSDDRRRIRVTLTEKGHQYISSVCAETDRVYRALIERIGQKDAREFIRITRKILEEASKGEEQN